MKIYIHIFLEVNILSFNANISLNEKEKDLRK